MDLRTMTVTDFVLLQDDWTSANCLELLTHLQPLRVLISQQSALDSYYLVDTAELSRLLASMLPGTSLADALALTSYMPAPALEGDEQAQDAPDPCIVLEDGYPIGFFDTELASALELTRQRQQGVKGIDWPEATLALLKVDAPDQIPLHSPIEVTVSLSYRTLGALADAHAALSLPLSPGATVDLAVQPRSGLLCAGPTVGQLSVPEAGETQPYTFFLRGVEVGLKKYRILAFHRSQPLGMLELSVLIAPTHELSGVSKRTQTYPMQHLDKHTPGLLQLLLEEQLAGKQVLVNKEDMWQGDAILPMVIPSLLQILWQDCEARQLVSSLVPEQLSLEERLLWQNLLIEELKALLIALFAGAETILVTPLVPGFSGAGVLKVRPFLPGSGGGGAFVVKFGALQTIAQEYRNYQQYVFFHNHSGRYTAAFKHEQTEHLGGILYAFAGADIRGTRDFGHIYQHWDMPAIKTVLENVFCTACEGWYANTSQLTPVDLAEKYHLPENPSPAELERTLKPHLSSIEFEDVLRFRAFPLSQEHRFPNPLRTFQPTRSFWRATYTATTHGDLNQRNILVDRLGYPWLIDFQKTGPSHILRDIATLDTVTRFQLLAAEQAQLDEFLRLEEQLYAVEYFDQLAELPEYPENTNAALSKMYQTVLYLRRLAGSLLKGPVQEKDMSEYYIALLYLTLDTLQYQTLAAAQHERALLSASLLVERLGLDR